MFDKRKKSWTNQTSCIEVCRGDQLIGYAIFFSGGWDAYKADGPNSLLCVGRNYIDRLGARDAILAGFDWRKGPMRLDEEERKKEGRTFIEGRYID